MQRNILDRALGLFHCATKPRTTVRVPVQWPEGDGWRDRFLEVRPEDRAALRKKGEERRAARGRSRSTRQAPDSRPARDLGER
jgi:hypothetical protein